MLVQLSPHKNDAFDYVAVLDDPAILAVNGLADRPSRILGPSITVAISRM